jgi:hypothetical protein
MPNSPRHGRLHTQCPWEIARPDFPRPLAATGRDRTATLHTTALELILGSR